MNRILVLMTADDYAAADSALQSAKAMARHPEALRWGVGLLQEPDKEQQKAMRRLGMVQFYYASTDSWKSMPALYRSEEYILMGHPGMRFARGWDAALLQTLRRLQAEGQLQTVLTGWLPLTHDLVDAVCPVAAEGFDKQGRLCFQRGAPLRYAAACQRSAFIHPFFCFGPAAFFGEMVQRHGPLFLRAHDGEWQAYTLHRPLIRQAWETPIPPSNVAEAARSGDRALRRFEQRWGLRLDQQQLTARARQGIFTGDRRFPVRIPLRVRLQERVRALKMGKCHAEPLCVTAYIPLDQPPNLPEEYLGWFDHLRALRQMPLLCYAEGESLRRLNALHARVREHKPRYGLPMKVKKGQTEPQNLFKLSKPFLLGTSRDKLLTYSHYVWIDAGYLRYPMYAHTYLDWDALCTDRIVLAAVAETPDLSMFVVPEALVQPLCDLMADHCKQTLKRTGHLPEETALWTKLIHERPEWFDVYDMPCERSLLTLLTTEGRAWMEGVVAREN